MYYIVFGFFYLISLLPFRVLYVLGDIIAFLLHSVIRYRRDVVYENVRGSFPEKSEPEVQIICRQFYSNFTDNWMETIKLLSISKNQLRARTTGNYEVLERLHEEGKTVCVISGHFFNWEFLATGLSLNQPLQLITVYMPISNGIMNRLFLHIRGRFGAHLMAATTLHREIIAWRRRQYVIGLVADQSPGDPGKSYWIQFLNRPTSVVTGPERNAQVFGQIPVFITISRKKRGYYNFHMEIFPGGETMHHKKGAITSWLAEKVEANVRAQPALYLWSHRRWKHAWKSEYASLWIDEKHHPPVA